MEENKKRTIPFLELAIIAIFVIIIILVVKICNQLEPAPEDTSNTRPESNEVKQENEYIKALKKYYEENNLLDNKNLDFWEIKTITKKNEYYLLDGSYKCLDDTSNCVYLEQTPEKKEDGSYKYSVYIEVKESNNEIIIESIFGTLNNDLEESKELTAYQITELLKAYYDSKEMIDKDNLEYWTTNKISLYARKENSEIFHYEGAYKCIDNSSDCIYIEQTNDSENNEYKIDLYIEIIDNSILQISGLYIDDNLTIIDQEIN